MKVDDGPKRQYIGKFKLECMHTDDDRHQEETIFGVIARNRCPVCIAGHGMLIDYLSFML